MTTKFPLARSACFHPRVLKASVLSFPCSQCALLSLQHDHCAFDFERMVYFWKQLLVLSWYRTQSKNFLALAALHRCFFAQCADGRMSYLGFTSYALKLSGLSVDDKRRIDYLRVVGVQSDSILVDSDVRLLPSIGSGLGCSDSDAGSGDADDLKIPNLPSPT
ncbi:hypothetical protein EXIGLDRAFT_234772 [Exidia glandulosa HHB12029]|uniref:Uncharacterized protein n=1 Tax=Exidia glandulosa HHB12029 TaxID=1314781 RepID=A0A165MKZ3_EXIGL|nr:hypothetical protein EXIGLDRAFT_234772 [Exidia glandulosa HHB12029]